MVWQVFLGALALVLAFGSVGWRALEVATTRAQEQAASLTMQVQETGQGLEAPETPEADTVGPFEALALAFRALRRFELETRPRQAEQRVAASPEQVQAAWDLLMTPEATEATETAGALALLAATGQNLHGLDLSCSGPAAPSVTLGEAPTSRTLRKACPPGTGAALHGLQAPGADLTGANLSGAALPNANLRDARMPGARLDRADVQASDLQSAKLMDASLQGARLGNADLSFAVLFQANLRGADLRQATLRHAALEGVNLAAANLRGADMTRIRAQGADLSQADLTDATLDEADLEAADLRQTDFTGANLQDADLSHANLQGAIFLNADLRGATFEEADLTRADLSGADMAGSRLSRANISQVTFCNAAQCAQGLYQGNINRAWAWADQLPSFASQTQQLDITPRWRCDPALREAYERQGQTGGPEDCFPF